MARQVIGVGVLGLLLAATGATQPPADKPAEVLQVRDVTAEFARDVLKEVQKKDGEKPELLVSFVVANHLGRAGYRAADDAADVLKAGAVLKNNPDRVELPAGVDFAFDVVHAKTKANYRLTIREKPRTSAGKIHLDCQSTLRDGRWTVTDQDEVARFLQRSTMLHTTNGVEIAPDVDNGKAKFPPLEVVEKDAGLKIEIRQLTVKQAALNWALVPFEVKRQQPGDKLKIPAGRLLCPGLGTDVVYGVWITNHRPYARVVDLSIDGKRVTSLAKGPAKDAMYYVPPKGQTPGEPVAIYYFLQDVANPHAKESGDGKQKTYTYKAQNFLVKNVPFGSITMNGIPKNEAVVSTTTPGPAGNGEAKHEDPVSTLRIEWYAAWVGTQKDMPDELKKSSKPDPTLGQKWQTVGSGPITEMPITVRYDLTKTTTTQGSVVIQYGNPPK